MFEDSDSNASYTPMAHLDQEADMPWKVPPKCFKTLGFFFADKMAGIMWICPTLKTYVTEYIINWFQKVNSPTKS